MASPLTEAREHVAGLLAALDARVYVNPVEAPTPPCLEITAAPEWVLGKRLSGGTATVSLIVRATVAASGGNSEALVRLESLVWDVMGVVPIIRAVPPPTLRTDGLGDVYFVDMQTKVIATD